MTGSDTDTEESIMKALKGLLHLTLSLTAVFLLAVAPCLYTLDSLRGNAPDAVSGASIRLPDKPSGDYIILLNRSLHESTVEEWTAFFRDGELNVIFDDISVLAAKADTTAVKMAERFRAQLPENQMNLRTEDPVLLASKAENGCIDAAIFSKEMADMLGLGDMSDERIVVIFIKDGGEEK